MQGEPSGLLVFCIVVLAISGVVLMFAVIGHLARVSRGEAPLVPDRVRQVWRESVKGSGAAVSPGPAAQTPDGSDRRAEPEPPRSSHMNGVEPIRTDGSGSVQLGLNADEIEAVARMIKHNATAVKPSKSSTIQAGFGVSRGGSAAYVRASLIYDALFGQPEPAIATPIAGRPTRAKFTNNEAS